MNNEFDDIEKAMRRLPIRQPSATLDERVLGTIATPVKRTNARWIISAIGGLAAAAMVMIAVWPQGQITDTEPVAPRVAIPMMAIGEATETWMDEGIVEYTSDGPVRQYVVQTHQPLAVAGGEGYLVEETLVQFVSQAY